MGRGRAAHGESGAPELRGAAPSRARAGCARVEQRRLPPPCCFRADRSRPLRAPRGGKARGRGRRAHREAAGGACAVAGAAALRSRLRALCRAGDLAARGPSQLHRRGPDRRAVGPRRGRGAARAARRAGGLSSLSRAPPWAAGARALTAAQVALGAGAELLERLDALIAAHPFRERLRGQRMLALYRDGRQAEALEAYLEARGMLLDELGIEPGTALRELEQAMLRQDPSLDAPARPATEALPPEGRRKVVTILFADVASPDTLDPELLRATSTDALGRMRSVLETHGATIEQRGGDEVMAVFGVPTAYEDDPLRAVRAALELRAEWSFAAGSPRERSSPARTTRTASSRARRSRSPSGFCKPPRQGRSWSARRRSSCSATRRCRSQSERRGGSSSSSREPRLRLGIWTRRSW